MNILQLVAREMNQEELYSKAFAIPSSVIIDGEKLVIKIDHILSNDDDFAKCIDTYYTVAIDEPFNQHSTNRKYMLLPEQIFITTERQGNGNYISYPCPAQFVTCQNQRYLFTGAITLNVKSLSRDHYSVVLRRQDCVYLFNDHRLVDRFHIDYLPVFFKRVILV